MGLLQKTFRLWWQKPKRIADIEEERSVSFLELFYDLAYVVIIIQLTHILAGHLDLVTFVEYIGLYALVWFAWINGSWYHELHGNNDIRSRVFTFLQMFFLAWMGIFIHSATGEGYQGFAIAYAGFMATLTYLWWRTGVHDEEHRPLSNPYSLVFVLATGAFLYSTQLTSDGAQMVWFAAVAGVLFLPIFMMWISRSASPEHVEQAQRIRPSLVERFGLLTIILLGENVISIVGGATHLYSLSLGTILEISFSLLIVFSLWWVYFDFVAGRIPTQTLGKRMTWMYLHLPLTMSIGLTAVGLLNLIEYVEEFSNIDRWFMVGPVALFLIVVSLISKTLVVIYENNHELYRQTRRTAIISAGLLIAVGFTDFSAVITLALTWLLLTAPVFSAFKVWVRRRYEESLQAGG